MKYKLWIWIVSLPIALLAALLSPNEYLDQGIKAVDCDGPIGIMIFATATYLIYGSGILIYFKLYRKYKNRYDLIVVIFCISILLAITPNTSIAMEQHSINSTLQECKN